MDLLIKKDQHHVWYIYAYTPEKWPLTTKVCPLAHTTSGLLQGRTYDSVDYSAMDSKQKEDWKYEIAYLESLVRPPVKEEKKETVNHPAHYNRFTVECIEIAEQMSFNLGNALKYIWRCGEKGCPIEDLKKAKWYIEREISRITEEGERK